MKTFFYNKRIPLLEWYFAGASCFFCINVFSQTMLVTTVVLGFVNTYLTKPIVFALTPTTEEEKEAYMANKPNVWKEIGKSMALGYSIYAIYAVVNAYLFTAVINPFVFGILYWVLDRIIRKLVKKWY